MNPTRRTALTLALPALAAACARRDEPAPLPQGPPSYGHLTPLRLDVGALDIVEASPGAATLVVPPAPVDPGGALGIMARDRLVAVGGPGRARFSILAASLTRQPESGGGVFSAPTERLFCTLRVRLEILGEEAEPRGFAEAEVRRSATRPAGNPTERAASADQIVRQAMADMNVEFEYQVRQRLRRFLASGSGAATAPMPEREDLPRP